MKQDSDSIKMLFAGHEIRDSTKAIRVAARVVFLCANLFFRAFFHNFPILATDGKTVAPLVGARIEIASCLPHNILV